MSSQDLHQLILRWPHTDANEVIVTGTFDQWSSSLHLTRKPDGFEAPAVYIPWRDKIAYKFIVDGRWMTNDAEPTEVDHGFVNNVYTAPAKPVLPEREPSTAPPSYHSDSEVEHEPVVEKVVDKPTTTNGAAVHVVHPANAAPVPDNESVATIVVETVRETVAPVVEAAQAAVAQVAPAPIEVEKAADEITSEPEAPKDVPVPVPAAPEQQQPIQIPVPEVAPRVPIDILPNSSAGPSENATPAATPAATQVDPGHERSTHVPLRLASGTTPAVVAPATELEESALSPVKEEDAPEMTTSAPEETTPAPEKTTPVPEETKLAPEESTPVPVETEVEEPAASAAPEEPTPAPPAEPEPVPVPAVVEESPQEPEVVAAPAPASQEPAVVPEPSSEPAPEPVPVVAAVPVPAAESAPVDAPAPAAEPTPVVEATTPAAAPEPTPQVAPALNGHSKTLSGASTSTAATSLPATPARKTSRKFSFPGHGKDKSANSSPTGSSRFASQQKRDKRHSLLNKLKEIFSDKGKKEKNEAKA